MVLALTGIAVIQKHPKTTKIFLSVELLREIVCHIMALMLHGGAEL